MAAPDTWEKAIPNQLGPLMRAIEELDGCLEAWGAEGDARYLAQLAVEELGTNIIKYGYDDAAGHTITLRAAPDPEGFRIWLIDDGHEFDPCNTPEPDPNLPLEARKPGGWGLSLVRRMLARMDYKRESNRNILCVLVPHRPEPLI